MNDTNVLDKLATLDKDGKPPESRIGTAWSLYQIWFQIKQADFQSSLGRAKIDAVYDGATPLSATSLVANGQSYRPNVNWGWARTVLDAAASGYTDIFNATELIFECPTTVGDPNDRRKFEKIVAQEVTKCIRSWPDFFPTYLRLCTFFIKHGVGVTYFMDEFDWRFKATNLSDFKIERDQEVGQDNLGIACCLRFYSPTQLFQLIKDPKLAEESGWNVDACRKAIIDCAKGGNNFAGYTGYDWEKWEVLIKNNDIYWTSGTAQPQRIRVVHAWVQEYSGKVSHFMINDSEQTEEFLYRKIDRFENVYQAYTVFPYGVGTNGYYQGVRGQGFEVSPISSALDRATNSLLELCMFGSAPTIHVKTPEAMQEMQFIPQGGYNLLAGDAEITAPVVGNLSQSVLPVLGSFQQMLRDRTGNSNTQQLIDSNTEKTKFQVQAELGSIAKMSTSALNLFYDPWQNLVREMVRRMVNGAKNDYGPLDPGGAYIVGLKKRLLQAGGQAALEAFKNLDIDRLNIVKAIGSGSEAARLLAMERLMPFLNSMPDQGRAAFIYDIFADSLGYQNAARYVTPPDQEVQFSPEVGVAQVESNQLLAGQQVQVIPGQNDAAHAREHIAIESPLIDQVQQAMELDPMSLIQILPGLNLLDAHTQQHVERLSRDENYKEISAQYRKFLQNADEILMNSTLHIQKLMKQQAMQQQAAQQNGEDPQQQQGQQIDPAVIAKIQGEVAVRQAKLETNNALAQQKIQINEVEARQKRAIADADAAAKIARELPGLQPL